MIWGSRQQNLSALVSSTKFFFKLFSIQVGYQRQRVSLLTSMLIAIDALKLKFITYVSVKMYHISNLIAPDSSSNIFYLQMLLFYYSTN